MCVLASCGTGRSSNAVCFLYDGKVQHDVPGCTCLPHILTLIILTPLKTLETLIHHGMGLCYEAGHDV